MNNTNTITFKYRYPETVTDRRKYGIDIAIVSIVTKAFWKMCHDGLITGDATDVILEGGTTN